MDQIVVRYTGEAFVPLGRSLKYCEHNLVTGHIYRLDIVEERSEANHRHYFAAVNQAWANLPENIAAKFPNSEMFRKFCLIKTGYCTKREIVAATESEALRICEFIYHLTNSEDDYAIVTLEGKVVTVWKAQSQRYRAMGKKAFNESKQAVLEYCASLIGVSVGLLEQGGWDADDAA